ncbi:MAG: 3'-5' exonuclease [Pontiellaceae bacterium]|jgi:DNA polymerase III epsilon subunit family exonuclease|nr:3'-5' exonuclease [Pontiellaceae bacterium]
MFVKEKISVVVILACGALFAGEPDLSAPVTNLIFTAFDTETTGFSPEQDRLIEIGAVRFRGNGEIIAVTNWLINPERDISIYAAQVHGIQSNDVQNAPLFKAVFPQFEAFCAGTILLAHNATFDVGFLRAELTRNQLDLPALPVLDTLPLFRAWFPGAPSHSLEPLSVYLGTPDDIYHRAEADAFHLISIFNTGMKQRLSIQLRQLEREAGGFKWINEGRSGCGRSLPETIQN